MENNQIAKIEKVTDKELANYLDVMGLAQKLTEKEKLQFLEISKAFGLNPFKREIYCSKYGEGPNAQTSIIVGYETYIKRAERSGQLDGWQVVTEGKPEDNSLKAIITIHRKDRKVPFVHEVYYSEYVQKTNAGAVTKFWQKAYTMTKKVAMAQGFRLCFSDELGGIPYTQEEMPETIDVQYTEVKETAPTISQEEKIKQAYECIFNSQNADELKANWKLIGKEMQLVAEIVELKDGLKAKFTAQPA